MRNLYKKIFPALLLSLSIAFSARAQLYISGNTTNKEIWVDGTSGATPTLYVNGYINNNGGELWNDAGSIELTGDWTNTPGASGSYESNGSETFSGSSAATVSGTMNGTVSDINQFYNLKINKTTSGTTVSLAANANVNAAGTVQFTGNGIIRTDASSHGSNGSLYAYELYVQNSSTAAITGYATSGANKYIEGRLRREVTGTANYYFPVGGQSSSLDGEEPFSLQLYSATASDIIGYTNATGMISMLGKIMFCDIGTDLLTTTGSPVSTGTTSPDGILDQLTTDCQYSIEWKAIGSAGTYTYDITGVPGPTLAATCAYYSPTAVGTLRYFADNGYPDNVSVLSSPSPFTGSSGYTVCPNDLTIAGISAAMNTVFRVHGVVAASAAILPIELVNFDGHILQIGNQLDWSTQSEKNSKYFILESSASGTNFSPIATINAAGNSSSEISYDYLDRNPIALTTYYRLKEIDIEGSYSYSNIVALTRSAGGILSVSPVPAENNLHVEYDAMTEGTVNISVYSLSGRRIFQQQWDCTKGVNVTTLDISSFNAAIYFIEVNDGRSPVRQTFIKQ